ncbi:MAG: hypothetical protein J5903_02060, partial [Clostridia bacterium]|nr:hypothetical protein [Clostridia bacterium]
MKKSVKVTILSLLTATALLFTTLFAVSCGEEGGTVEDPGTTYVSIFANGSSAITLDKDYAFSDYDVIATGGSGKEVRLGASVTLDLGGHVLDMSGYTLKVAIVGDKVVTLKNGTVKNGTLDISVPDGDVNFDNVTLDESVTYTLEAASETIKFSNAAIKGKGIIKSDTSVKITNSDLKDVTLTGGATLNTGVGATLGALKVGENAVGAKLNVAPEAKIATVEIKAPVTANIHGEVNSLTVAEEAKSSTAELSVKIGESAKVVSLELKAAATVEVSGEVSTLNVADSAKEEGKTLSLTINATATVNNVALNAPATVEVSGRLDNVVVEDAAEGAVLTVTGNANVSAVVVKAENTRIDSEEQISVYVLDTLENVEVSDSIETESVNGAELDDIVENITAHTHVYVLNEEYGVPADCENEGYEFYECECGKTYIKKIAPLGHDWEYDEDSGNYVCARCGVEQGAEFSDEESVFVKGLRLLGELLGDGYYSEAVSGEVLVPGSDPNKVVINKANSAFAVQDGKVQGTIDIFATAYFVDETTQTMCIVGKIEDNVVKVRYDVPASSNGSGCFISDVSSLVPILIGSVMNSSYGYSLNNLGMVESFAEGFAEGFNETLGGGADEYIAGMIADADLKPIADFIFRLLFTGEETADGKTVYKFTFEHLEELTESTPADIFDNVFGENAYEDLKTFVRESLDKKVIEFVFDILDYASAHDVTEDDINGFVQTLCKYLPIEQGEDFDIISIARVYYDRTVAEVAAELLTYAKAMNNYGDNSSPAYPVYEGGDDYPDDYPYYEGGEDDYPVYEGDDDYPVYEGGDGFAAMTADDVKEMVEKAFAEADLFAHEKISDNLGILPDSVAGILQTAKTFVGEGNVEIYFTMGDDGLESYEISVELTGADMGAVDADAAEDSIFVIFHHEIGYMPTLDLSVDFMGVSAFLEHLDNGEIFAAEAFGNSICITLDRVEDACCLFVEAEIYVPAQQYGSETHFTLNAEVTLTPYVEDGEITGVDVHTELTYDNLNEYATAAGRHIELKLDRSLRKTETDPFGDVSVEVPQIRIEEETTIMLESANNGFGKTSYGYDDNKISHNYSTMTFIPTADETGEYFRVIENFYVFEPEEFFIADGVKTYRGYMLAETAEYRVESNDGVPALTYIINKDCGDRYAVMAVFT